MRTHEIEGSYRFRSADLDVVLTCEYDDDSLSVTEMFVKSDRRGCLVEASDRLAAKFEEAHWDVLWAECLDHERGMAEYYRDMSREAA